jgi:hypothetical protein
LIASAYNFLNSPNAIPKPGATLTQLKTLAIAANRLERALLGLNEPAIEWLLAYDPPAPLYQRSREGGETLGQAPNEFLERCDMALKEELAAHGQILVNWPSMWEGDDQEKLRDSFRALVEARVQNGPAADEAIKAKAAEAERAFNLRFALGLMTPPAPYHVRDRLADKIHALAVLADMARERGLAHGVESSANRRTREIRIWTPKEWMAQSCLDVIQRAFGLDGLEKVTSYRSASDKSAMPFRELLRSLETYATGRKPTDFSDVMLSVKVWRDDRLRRMGRAGRARGRKQKDRLTS